MPLAPRLLKTSGALEQKLSKCRIGNEFDAKRTCAVISSACVRCKVKNRGAAEARELIQKTRTAAHLVLGSHDELGANEARHPWLRQYTCTV